MTVFRPSATYRVQLHKDFTFKSLKGIIPYLKSLGIDTIYASPIFKAIKGSQHGYDGVDPLTINPEIGTEKELLEISALLKENNMFWIQDIVPNHMAFSNENEWLMDVLKKGTKSAYFHYFDIDFPTNLSDKRLMVPFLGEDLQEAIAENKLKVVLKDRQLLLNYGDANWPINDTSYDLIFNQKKGKKHFDGLVENTGNNTNLIKKLKTLNADKRFLANILNQQHYRLCNWQETNQQINYRRFFTVNVLICLNIQHADVFDHYHQYVVELVKKDVFQGLRIDHVDGLANPAGYLEMLRTAVGENIYISVEKILEENEQLPSHWLCEGSTGYDFLQMANNVLTNTSAKKAMDRIYQEQIGKKLKLDELILAKKRSILLNQMAGELDNLYQLFQQLNSLNHAKISALPAEDVKVAIADFLVHFPVYRFYQTTFPIGKVAKTILNDVFKQARKNTANSTALKYLAEALLNNTEDAILNSHKTTFYNRCMQFSGPLMAKGIEDTLMYTYNRFLAHNEVGDSPKSFGLEIKEFHQLMEKRARLSPLAMNCTATHDTKRGEDVRTRLDAIADNPNQWQAVLTSLQQILPAENIHPNDAYFVYQTLVGTLPMTESDIELYKNRLGAYMEKVLREAKKRSDWAYPDEDYERKVQDFALRLVDAVLKSESLQGDLKKLTKAGMFNSLIQLVLKVASPGIPDIYQGTELWDLSFVDPDNRRPVDYKLRKNILNAFKGKETLSGLWADAENGKLKLGFLHTLLTLRKNNKKLFEHGDYHPVKVRGKYKKQVLAFVRSQGLEKMLFVLPLGIGSLADDVTKLNKIEWGETHLKIDYNLFGEWKDLLNPNDKGNAIITEQILLKDLLGDFPIAILSLHSKPNNRSSGIFMPISSLSSKHEIGGLGKEAYDFVDFLYQCKQRYWQLLPSNPVNKPNAFSPYSSNSSMAGNILMISPDLLVDSGWLNEDDLNYSNKSSDRVDYERAVLLQENYLKLAYKQYQKSPGDTETDFENFIREEDYWLHDFALFTLLSQQFGDKQWGDWPEGLKSRDQNVIGKFSKKNESQLREIKWQQFVFDLQWNRLKKYAKRNNVEFIGDLPIYISYHSADVWANQHLFKLTENRKPAMVAGVPPDAFSDDGQLWGMPVFNWQIMKEEGYEWWINRVRKNLSLYQLIRLDHFRAFHTYWEVKAGSPTAKNGTWVNGPGKHFFDVLKATFGDLPFIAEDLGSDMDDALIFREKLGLPGMKVLQFGFGKDMATSADLPHNFLDRNSAVYVGTHDNDTAVGWFARLSATDRERLDVYFGSKVTKDNVHELLNRLALSSNVDLAILQMQDVLGLDNSARINVPGTSSGNWVWRIKPDQISKNHIQWLARHTVAFGRR